MYSFLGLVAGAWADLSSVSIAKINSEWRDAFVAPVFFLGVQSDQFNSAKL